MKEVEILATGKELIGRGIRGSEPVMQELIAQAQSEIHMLAYVFTPQAIHLLELLEKAAEKGVRIQIVVNSLETQDRVIQKKLRSLAAKFPHAEIVDFRDPGGKQLHAKIIVSDRRRALVGSANFTWGGMFGNYEIGLLVEGQPAWELAKLAEEVRSIALSR
jgi:phosphatidylserine/phosphatidylglycerophosphate/cardiolipin synthase-like enzyme